MLEPVVEVAKYAGQTIVVPVVVAWLTVKVTTARRDVAREVLTYEHVLADSEEDLRRWIRDRDRAALWTVVQTAPKVQDAAKRQLAHTAAAKLVYSDVLQELRDEVTLKERRLAEAAAEEGWRHDRYRKRRALPRRGITPSVESRGIVADWRDRAGVDVLRPDHEPVLDAMFPRRVEPSPARAALIAKLRESGDQTERGA